MIETTKALQTGKETEKQYTAAEDLGMILAKLPEAERVKLLYIAKGVELATDTAAHRAG